MVKSMFAGVAGLRAHQSKMDIIGNNIANVNTWGYKAASMSFKDAMYQSTSTGSGGNTAAGGYGGTDANQIGLGVSTGAITYDFSAGGMSPSSRALDCMIDGNGFFIVGPMVSGGSVTLDSDDAVENSGLYLSRVGIFKVDNNGYLTDDGGNYVYGFVNSNSDLTDGSSFNTTSLQPLKIPTSADMAAINNNNASDSVAAAKKKYEDAMAVLNAMKNAHILSQENYAVAKMEYDSAVTAISSTSNTDPNDPTSPLLLGEIPQYKIDNTTTPPSIVLDTTKLAFTTSDDLADKLDQAKVAMEAAYKNWTKDSTNNTEKYNYLVAKQNYDAVNNMSIKAQATLKAPKALDDAAIGGAVDTALDTYHAALKAYLETSTSAATYDTVKGTMETAKKALEDLQAKLLVVEDDSPQGRMSAAEQDVTAAKAKMEAAQKTADNAETAWKNAQNGAITTAVDNAGADDELAELENYRIQEDGTLIASTKAGNVTINIGKIALAAVQNSSGLVKDSGYYYSPSANSGRVSTFEAGGSAGRILGNYREMSKVDLATELTEMITTQRGFQANSKIITVTDSMLEELVNMKR